MAAAARRVVMRIGETRGIDRDLARFLARTARVAILVCGAITALGTVGVNVTALVAGLGLTGFALGFALKDIISNMLAGVMILIYKPFRQEDRITVKSFNGIVERIDLRYTVLRSDGKEIYVPNSILFTDAITVERVSSPPSAVAAAEQDN
ncbi:MAG: mechanosensitive ion channel [Planctomycetes bacterium]|nr:mechanosensitive ion channel [Planctomycetota bacterium]